MKKLQLFLFVLLLFSNTILAQDKFREIQDKLVMLSLGDIPALNQRVNISVTDVSIQEFLRGIATNTNMNINVDPSLKIQVVNNFSDVKAIDILMFICRQYDLNISVIGNIITVFKDKIDPPVIPKKTFVSYDENAGLISINCDNEDLINVTKEIVDQTGLNVVTAPGIDRTKVSTYIQNMPIDNALDKLAYGNNLKIKKTEDDVFLVEKSDPPITPVVSKRDNSGKRSAPGNDISNLQVTKLFGDTVAIIAENAAITDIVKEVTEKLKIDYFLTSPIAGDASIVLKHTSFPYLLQSIFRGTAYTFQVKNGVYILGENKNREMKETRIIQIQNRTVDTLLAITPIELKSELQLKEFSELNSLLVCGLPDRINTLEAFIKKIDKVVPVISIEVMIVDITNSHTITTGIEAGIGKNPVTTGGQVYPTVGNTDNSLTLNSQSINNLINSFNGFGSIKIGNVTPNFYVNLKAMESNGILKIRSTPKLVTLNGHSANMAITRVEYYQEQTNNIYGSLSTQSTLITAYKEQRAEMSVKIRPVVSGDDQITLEIEVNQEEFTSRTSVNSPFGKESRKFKSLIRVKNGEMILLGGLEEKRDNQTGSGVPFLSRIPIIKWFFSSKIDDHSDKKLNIFIKPSILE